MRVLVVGGTRFIGRHTVQTLLDRGHQVTLFHRGSTPSPFGDRAGEILGDRLDRTSVADALGDQALDAVIDIAYAWDSRTGAKEIGYIADTLEGHARKYVYLSSVSVYGDGPLPLREDSPRDPLLGAYSEDKIAAEDYLFDAHRQGRFDVSIIRPPYVYGPWNNIPREAWFWDRILAGRPVIVPDDGRTLFQWAAAKDVAWALAECLGNPAARGEAFNIAEAQPLTYAEFIDRLAHVAGTPVEKAFVPRKRIHELGGSAMGSSMYFGATLDAEVDFSVSIEKARRLLGFRPTDPTVGLGEAYAWYLAHDRGRHPKFTFDKEVLGR
ncbi:MAG TPA: NAD-dependent epimerase/dehydratase family protein [Thermoplasmata archaeon]|nr:NAD-dependent epimerase/dehydratase family protein [Thermoplasmata archaeon]